MVDRIGHASCIKSLKIIVKYFFLADIFFLGAHLEFGSIHFPLADAFHLGGGGGSS